VARAFVALAFLPAVLLDHQTFCENPDMRRPLLFLSLTLVCFVCACNSGSSSSGHSSTPPPAFYTIDAPSAAVSSVGGTFPLAINPKGQIVGYAIDAHFDYVAFLLNPDGTLTPDQVLLNGASHQGIQYVDINSSSTILGKSIAVDENGAEGFPKTVVGGFLSPPPQGSSGFLVIDDSNVVVPASLNDHGDVAGMFIDSNNVSRGFLHLNDGTSTGVFTFFDLPGNTNLTVSRINATDQIIGTFSDSAHVNHGFLRLSDGTILRIDAPGAGTQPGNGTALSDINSLGAIVGSISTPSGSHSLLRTTGGAFTVFDPPGSGPTGSLASAINSIGTIAGTFYDSNSIPHAYVRHLDGTYEILDHPSASQSPSAGTSASRINDSGQVIGVFVDAQGTSHGFVRK
jgi:hypothetical protein